MRVQISNKRATVANFVVATLIFAGVVASSESDVGNALAKCALDVEKFRVQLVSRSFSKRVHLPASLAEYESWRQAALKTLKAAIVIAALVGVSACRITLLN
jgi:hypothetical protein